MKRLIYYSTICAVLLFGCKDPETENKKDTLSIDQKSVSVTYEAGSQDILISTTASEVTTESDQSWLTATAQTRYITIAWEANTEPEERSAELVVKAGNAEGTIEVNQTGAGQAVRIEVGCKTEDGQGMIFWVDPDNGEIAKALSINRLEGEAWGISSQLNLTSMVNGSSNTALIPETADYNAAQFCRSLGTGWYVPSLYELLDLFDLYNGVSYNDPAFIAKVPASITAAESKAREDFDTMLKAAGSAAGLNTSDSSGNGESYWSSTEYDSENAYFVRFGKFSYEPAKKVKTTRFVRCMKTIGDYQYGPEPAIMTVSPLSVTLESGAGSTVTSEIVLTNQTVFNTAVATDAAAWLSASVAGTTITFTALSENTLEPRSGEVTITAGEGSNTVSSVVTVSQKQKPAENGFKIGEFVTDGVVFYVAPNDATKAKVVSLGRIESISWTTVETPQLLSATHSTSDGATNTAEILASANYVASEVAGAYYCASLGEGWYWPALEELKTLFAAYNGKDSYDNCTNAKPEAITTAEQEARAAFDKVLTDNGGTAINTTAANDNGERYWSSTESDDGTKAQYLRFGKPNYEPANKNQSASTTLRYVRCVKNISK